MQIVQMLVIRDSENKVINIGEWDYMHYLDSEGVEREANPLPEGILNTIEDVRINEDGSRTVVF